MNVFLHIESNPAAFSPSLEAGRSRLVEESLKALRAKQQPVRDLFFKMLASSGELLRQEAYLNKNPSTGVKRLYDQDDVHYMIAADSIRQEAMRFLKKEWEFLNTLDSQKPQSMRREEEVAGRKCCYDIEWIPPSEYKRREWDREKHSGFDQAMLALEKLKKRAGEGPIEYERRVGAEFKRLYPASYSHGHIRYIVEVLNELEEQKKNLPFSYLLCTVRSQVEGKQYALTRYFMRIYQEPSHSSLKRLADSHIVVIHQDLYLIEPTLQEIAKLFEEVIAGQWTKEELIQRVGVITYLFLHCQPYAAGGAVMGFMLESVLYRYHGYELKGRCVAERPKAFGALTLKRFLETYNPSVQRFSSKP